MTAGVGSGAGADGGRAARVVVLPGGVPGVPRRPIVHGTGVVSTCMGDQHRFLLIFCAASLASSNL